MPNARESLSKALTQLAQWLAAPEAVGAPAAVPSVFAPDGLQRLEDFSGYNDASPFPHLVLDNLFDPATLRAIVAEWPSDREQKIETHNDGVYVKKKRSTTWDAPLGPNTRRFLDELNGPRVLLALEKVTGIFGLLPDPYLFGGGLHMTGAGGSLAVHADFNKHPRFQLDRRLNLLVYLNEDWTDANQGWLELWDRNMSRCEKRILPVFNRTVVFSTTSHSFHGQPEPILGGAETLRRSIAFYYFTNGRPASEVEEDHSTLWKERPGQGY